ncbi:hypothetical protein [Desulfovibrio sp. UCD-KL4C]|uniref:hypothetical protein n=1 Tax=Desulfovibrio sp. UCD-KL4C TaxID=2578120 RepID=UPI0025BC24BF|nr:hypothetical protein [Desulfovibrio sp. UCD-KL4C]
MLSLDGVTTAWNVLEWNLSFSIGDVVTLAVALVTAWIALLTCRIQGEQKSIVEQQNKIIERQVSIDEAKFQRDNNKFKYSLALTITKITTVFQLDEVPKKEWFKIINDNITVIDEFFSRDAYLFVTELLRYRLKQRLSFEEGKSRLDREESIKRITEWYLKIAGELYKD